MALSRSAFADEMRLVESYCAVALKEADAAVAAALAWAKSGEARRPHEVKALTTEPEAPGMTDAARQVVEPVRWALEAVEKDLRDLAQGAWMRDPDRPHAPPAAEALDAARRHWVERLQARVKDVERAIADVHTGLNLPWSLEWLAHVRKTGMPPTGAGVSVL